MATRGERNDFGPSPKLRAWWRIGIVLTGAFEIISLPLIVPLLPIFAAHRLARVRLDEHEEKTRQELLRSARQWLDDVEADTLNRLKHSANKLVADLRARITATTVQPSYTTVTPKTKTDLLQSVRTCMDTCRAILRTEENP